MNFRTLFLTSALVLPVSQNAFAVPQDSPKEFFDDSITVALDTVVVRVVDGNGEPILGLSPADFRVRVKGREVPVAAVDWVSSSGAEERSDDEATIADREPRDHPSNLSAAPNQEGKGKLVVVFVQADLNPTRISGQLRLRPYSAKLIASLAPADRVAVVSFDSHLKLRLDFTDDREAVLAAIDEGMVYSPESDVEPSASPSIAERFDFAEALRVATPERALEMTAKALTGIPGEKTMLYLGWGLGRFDADGVHMTPDYEPAVAALTKARLSVFVLDVTSADTHSLEVGLESVAAATGGTYASTFRLPGLATTRLARAISGWYVLTFDRDALKGLPKGEAVIELLGRKGEVLARPVRVR